MFSIRTGRCRRLTNSGSVRKFLLASGAGSDAFEGLMQAMTECGESPPVRGRVIAQDDRSVRSE
jgi:hypothetical protein